MSKRVQKNSSYPDALSDRDVSKIRKLLIKTNNEDRVVNKTFIPTVHLEVDCSDTEDKDDFSNIIYDIGRDENDESHGDWEKFVESSNNTHDLFDDLQANLTQSKIEINEDMSQYSGSLPDLTGIDSEELPQDLRDHLSLLIDVLRNYRSGPLPKTLKVLPHLPGWECLLELLKPLEWSVHVFPKVIKIFSSKGHEPSLQFYENYLLPKVKEDIRQNRRLCVHLLEALISSMFRGEEFISGIFLPWVQSEMTKIEGVILSHLIKKASLKSNYIAVALVLLLEEEFSIPRSCVIETILRKHYHLPRTALLRVIKYFISFDRDCTTYYTEEERMPLIWFKTVLAFMDLYRDCIDLEERKQLTKLCKRHFHPLITPEIKTLLSLVS